MLKSHNCGALRKEHVGKQVTLAGWVDRRRDHGGLIFIDLRDREGIVQVAFNPETAGDAHKVANKMRNEYVVSVTGEVARRPPGTENLKLPTGEIEVIAREADILNPSLTPPFYINEDVEIEESLRLKYRYLDLRRAGMKENLLLRHRLVKFIRDFLDNNGFIEVETPILIKSTPEGARDYLVPSRVHAGKFYALPQSPQQLKQLLMVAGLEKYYYSRQLRSGISPPLAMSDTCRFKECSGMFMPSARTASSRTRPASSNATAKPPASHSASASWPKRPAERHSPGSATCISLMDIQRLRQRPTRSRACNPFPKGACCNDFPEETSVLFRRCSGMRCRFVVRRRSPYCR